MTCNMNVETGIHYGVIHSNRIDPDAFSDIESGGIDLDYEDAKAEVKAHLKAALKDYVYSTYLDTAVNDAFDAASDNMNLGESNGDCRRLWYDQDGYKISVHSDGDVFVQESPYYAMVRPCSPCAPNAGYLDENEGPIKAYCLGPEWFGEDSPMPYQCMEIRPGVVQHDNPR